ncbi:rmlA [Symbiodinium sp. CCMP2592]|nr:rmlA [Symbiodinium sp. CCMP2592]
MKSFTEDGDTFYTSDVVGQFRKIAATHNAVFCFHDTQPKPIYSYITMDDADNIKEVKEKVKISDWANTGCYCFRDGAELAKECEALIKRGETQLSQDQKGEFYTSGVIAAMISRGAPFKGIKLYRNDFHVLGTPTQVAEWCSSWPNQPKMRFLFDLHGTLLTAPQEEGDLRSCRAIERNVKLLRRLKAQGHHILIWTERPAERGAELLDALRRLGVEYNELHFGKPVADFYIDDRGVDPLLGDIDKQIGFYPTAVKVKEASPEIEAAKLRVGSAVARPKLSKEFLLGMTLGLCLGAIAGVAAKARLAK